MELKGKESVQGPAASQNPPSSKLQDGEKVLGVGVPRAVVAKGRAGQGPRARLLPRESNALAQKWGMYPGEAKACPAVSQL